MTSQQSSPHVTTDDHDALTLVVANERQKMKLTYAATKRCPCGAGLAYSRGQDAWDCSAILLGTADEKMQHTARLPFVFYEIKSEDQPSANGATTRPKATVRGG